MQHYMYIANEDGMDWYLADGTAVIKYIRKNMDIYSEYNHNDIPVRELVYSQKDRAFLKEVYVYYGDGTAKVIADPEHGWIGL